MLGKRKISAVFFDLDDTLVLTSEVDKKAYAEIITLARSQVPALDGFQLIQDWRGLFASNPWDPTHQVEVEEWRAKLWLQCLTNQGHPNPTLARTLQHCFSTTRLLHFEFLPGVPEMVADLQTKGYKCLVITNGHADVQRSKVGACTAEKIFDGVVIGGEEERKGGKQKPHPEIFATACQLAGCAPDQAVMVGDSLKADIQGGINAGLGGTVWVNVQKRPLMEGMPVPSHIVESVLQVPEYLEKLESW